MILPKTRRARVKSPAKRSPFCPTHVPARCVPMFGAPRLIEEQPISEYQQHRMDAASESSGSRKGWGNRLPRSGNTNREIRRMFESKDVRGKLRNVKTVCC